MAKKLKLGSGLENLINQKIKNSYSTSTTDTYSCDYVNGVINGVVESGSNDNGNWIKFNDGTMICTQRFNKTINIQTTWGSWYYGYATCKDYPIAFVGDLPAVSCTAYPKTATWCFGQLAHASDGPQTLRNPGSVMCIRPTSQANVDVIVQIIAIGRWK